MADHPTEYRGLRHFATRAQRDPFFVAFYLTTYGEQNGLTLPQVAAYVRCAPEGLKKLMLCRAPDPRTARFREDAVRVAEFAGCDVDRLGQILREVMIVSGMRGLVVAEDDARSVTLLAARDKHLKKRRSRRGHRK